MKTLGIIGAEQQEIDLLLEHLENRQEVSRASLTFYTGTISGYPTVIVRAGIGKVNAAACTQALISLFDAQLVINTGAAGSLDARIDIGDIVISTDVIQHDFDCTGLGYEPGEIPGTGLVFKADASLRRMAAQSAASAVPGITVFEGRILTGDRFVSGNDEKARLSGTFGGLCAEMEGGAVAQVCALNHIPFLILRAISDKADGSAVMDYPEFSRIASINSASLTRALILRLKEVY